MELVSVIMSVYNEKKEELRLAVESILEQTYKNLEFIIVLDNPNNYELKGYLKEVASNDERVVILENERNIGLTASLNKLLKHVNGEYIFRMDADDISKTDRVEKQLKYIKENNIDVLSALVEEINEQGDVVHKGKSYIKEGEIQKLRKILRYKNILIHPTWCVKKKVYDDLDGYKDIDTAEDYDFILRTMDKGYRIGILNDHVLHYRIRSTGISKSNPYKQVITAKILQDYYYNNLKMDIYDEKEFPKVLEYYSQNFISESDYEEYKRILSENSGYKKLFKLLGNTKYHKVLLYSLKLKLYNKLINF